MTTAIPDSPIKKIFNSFLSEEVLIPGLLNFARDWSWAFLSYDLLNLRLTQTDDADFDANGQWFSQQCYSTLTMLAALLSMAIFYKLKKPKDKEGGIKSFPWAEGFIYVIAASVSIYGWDRLQVAGINAAKNKGLSDNNAGYAAAALTGLEGFIQYATIVLFRTLTLSKYYTALTENPQKYGKQLLKGMGCSLTFVTLPGASWQVMFMLGTTNQWGVIPTSFAVALTVAFFNYVSVEMSIAFLKWISTSGTKNNAVNDLSDTQITISTLENNTEDFSAIPVVTDTPEHDAIAINETTDPTVEATDVTPLLKPKGWKLIKKHVVEKKDIYGRLLASKSEEIDYMPSAAKESTEIAPLGKMLSGITKALSAKKLSTRTGELAREDLQAPIVDSIDPAFGELVTEESGAFTPR